jgi:cysteine dioxygenase
VLTLRDQLLSGPGASRPLTAEELRAFAASIDLDALRLDGYEGFSRARYARNRVHLDDNFELVVICWEPGQASSIHDHGASHCLYVVVRGQMVEERFRPGEGGQPVAQGSRRFGPSDTTLAVGPEIHRISNPGTERLVTLHVYSPPLDERATHFTAVPTYE